MKRLILFVCLTFPLTASALDRLPRCESWVQSMVPGYDFNDTKSFKNFLWAYEQEQPNLDDPISDFIAIQKLRNIPRSVLKYLKTKTYEDMGVSEADTAETSYSNQVYVPAKEIVPLDTIATANAIVDVIEQERQNGLFPTVGKKHTWSRVFKETCSTQFLGVFSFSKLLISLMLGETARLTVVGQERNLEKWILNQPDNSISIEEMFRNSYRLNEGDIYKSILTIENTLSKFWRDPNRGRLIQTIKLKPLINLYGDEYDRFGSWYHFFGTMLYGYVAGSFKAKFVAFLESKVNPFNRKRNIEEKQNEKEEHVVNMAGASVGGKLRRYIRSQSKNRQPQSAAPNFDYQFDVDGDQFALKVHMRVKDMEPAQISMVLGNPGTIPAVSDVVKSIEISNKNNGIVMSTRIEKFGIPVTLVSDCIPHTTNEESSISCKMRTKLGTKAWILFRSGTSEIKCIKDLEYTNCNIEVKGRTKSFLHKSAQELAVSAAFTNLNDLAHIALGLSRRFVSPVEFRTLREGEPNTNIETLMGDFSTSASEQLTTSPQNLKMSGLVSFY